MCTHTHTHTQPTEPAATVSLQMSGCLSDGLPAASAGHVWLRTIRWFRVVLVDTNTDVHVRFRVLQRRDSLTLIGHFPRVSAEVRQFHIDVYQNDDNSAVTANTWERGTGGGCAWRECGVSSPPLSPSLSALSTCC